MNKRLTLLLAAAFSWLFISSIILFHQEHVLGKNGNTLSHQFIVPKTKDKVGYLLKQLPASFKVFSNMGFIISDRDMDKHLFLGVMTKLTVSPIGLFCDQAPQMIYGLRAPPVA